MPKPFLFAGLTAAVLALSMLSACANSGASAGGPPMISSADFEAALQMGDIAVVRRAAAGGDRAQAALASGTLAAWFREDDVAGARLTRAAHDPLLSDALRRCALLTLSGLRLRQGRYSDAVAALDLALPGLTNGDERRDLEQSRAFAAALTDVEPMQASVPSTGFVQLSRDLAGLNRGPVTVNDGMVDAIIDTGSAVSTISESNARRLGLRMLDRQVSVGTATSASAAATLAVADRLSFGGAQFRNVVFLVMPDAALTFANGAYVVHAIIGLPILLELGRITYTTTGTEALSFTHTGAHPSTASNLIVDGDAAYTSARIEGSATPARLFIDNGATTSHLNERFVAGFPTLMASAHRASVTRTGGAGSETQDALKLPRLVLGLGQASATITDIDVIEDHQLDRHGDLGLDALRTAPSYVFDFEAMRFELRGQAQ